MAGIFRTIDNLLKKIGAMIMDTNILDGISKVDSVSEKSISILTEAVRGKKNVLEIGTRFGRTAVILAMHCHPEGKVTSVDINQSDARKTLEQVPKEIRDKIVLIESDSKTVDYGNRGPFDLIFIDGDHSFKGVIADTLNGLANMTPDGTLFWHDYTCLDVLAGICTIPVERAQIDGYMGFTRGKPLPGVNAHLFQLERVGKAITEHLKSIKWGAQ
jgi:hypothetical protein